MNALQRNDMLADAFFGEPQVGPALGAVKFWAISRRHLGQDGMQKRDGNSGELHCSAPYKLAFKMCSPL